MPKRSMSRWWTRPSAAYIYFENIDVDPRGVMTHVYVYAYGRNGREGVQRRIENTEKHRARDEKFILVRAVWRNRTFEFLHFAPAERHRSKSILRLIWSVGIVFATGRLVVSLGFTCLWHPMRTYIHIFRHSHNNTPRCSTTGYLPLIMTSRCTSTRVVFLNIIAAGCRPT